jgi:hypothetical protein
MTTRSYSDLSDSATTFDPEEQFDRDIDERMKGMDDYSRLANDLERLCCAETESKFFDMVTDSIEEILRGLRIAAEHTSTQPAISAGQDAAIQDELDHPPASIMEEGK